MPVQVYWGIGALVAAAVVGLVVWKCRPMIPQRKGTLADELGFDKYSEKEEEP